MTAASPAQHCKLSRAVSVTVWLLAVSIAVSSCTSARSNLGTSDSSCYLALPAATKAVHSTGKLVGVQRSTLASVEKGFPRFADALHAAGGSGQRICLFAFSGEFSMQSVSKPRGRSDGKVAVVVLSTPTNRLLGTVIMSRAPLRFGHPHIG